ncbi:MOFRL family protein [Jannaschia ovalis]|uniref:MOFRL family protein n=1 Tax=Jannaschia ovalis TaxID=3038773 RepID=UPI0032639349
MAKAARGGPGLTLWGGETTVVLRGEGRGGRNQELALRVALALRDLGAPWAFLSGGTDGRDGPTDAAGAIVDDGTLARIAAAGLDVEAMLARNDSYPALRAAGDLLITGPTGTNVADLQILRVGLGAPRLAG